VIGAKAIRHFTQGVDEVFQRDPTATAKNNVGGVRIALDNL
jgi:hypothetical protein